MPVLMLCSEFFVLGIPEGHNVPFQLGAGEDVDFLHKGIFGNIDGSCAALKASRDIEGLDQGPVNLGEDILSRFILDSPHPGATVLCVVAEYVVAKVKACGYASFAKGRGFAHEIDGMLLAVGDKQGRSACAVRLNACAFGNGELVAHAFHTYAHGLFANGEQVGNLGDVIVASVDVQAYAQRGLIGRAFDPFAVFPGEVAMVIDDDVGRVFCAAGIDGMPEELLSVELEAQILQGRQLGFHEGGPVAPVLMAHEAVLQLDVREFRFTILGTIHGQAGDSSLVAFF